MALEIFGFAQSRAFRTLWMAEEIKAVTALEVEHQGAMPRPGPALDALLEMNPMGQVPVIRDDGFVLRESMAINLYLAKKYGVLALDTPEDEALAMQWSFWVMTAVESHSLDALKYKLGAMGASQDETKVNEEMAALARPLRVLDGHLAKNTFLVGEAFSVADLNVASVLMWLRMATIELPDYSSVSSWLTQSLSRPAVEAARTY